MSLSIHIPFYNQNPQKKEGYRQLTRFDFLKENIDNLKKLSIKTNIFVHTHNNFFYHYDSFRILKNQDEIFFYLNRPHI